MPCVKHALLCHFREHQCGSIKIWNGEKGFKYFKLWLVKINFQLNRNVLVVSILLICIFKKKKNTADEQNQQII